MGPTLYITIQDQVTSPTLLPLSKSACKQYIIYTCIERSAPPPQQLTHSTDPILTPAPSPTQCTNRNRIIQSFSVASCHIQYAARWSFCLFIVNLFTLPLVLLLVYCTVYLVLVSIRNSHDGRVAVPMSEYLQIAVRKLFDTIFLD